jgi:mannosyltransferase OCH1-like enzyme
VPEETTAQVEQFWEVAARLHSGWEMVTFRDPIDPTLFPITGPYWHLCQTGAQLAGLVRLEALWNRGGCYIDSDFECYRPFTPLMDCQAFAGWEDAQTVPDAVIAAERQHPAIIQCINLALRRLQSDSDDWRTGNGAWATGPGVTTTVLPGRGDVLLLAPGSLYPYHYTEKHRRDEDHKANHPYAFGAHHWAHSWRG